MGLVSFLTATNFLQEMCLAAKCKAGCPFLSLASNRSFLNSWGLFSLHRTSRVLLSSNIVPFFQCIRKGSSSFNFLAGKQLFFNTSWCCFPSPQLHIFLNIKSCSAWLTSAKLYIYPQTWFAEGTVQNRV